MGYMLMKQFTTIGFFYFILVMQFFLHFNNVYAGDELNRIKLFPDFGSKENPLILEFSGKSFGENGVSLLRDRSMKSDDPVIQFFREMYGHIENDRKDKYIEFWQKKYRLKTKEFYQTNSIAWPRYVDLLKSALDYKLIKIINYGDYRIAQILNIRPDNKVFVSSITLLQTKNKFFRTNDLKDDFIVPYFTQIDARKEIANFKSQKSKKTK